VPLGQTSHSFWQLHGQIKSLFLVSYVLENQVSVANKEHNTHSDVSEQPSYFLSLIIQINMAYYAVITLIYRVGCAMRTLGNTFSIQKQRIQQQF
jgi:hypothetical protein